MRLLTHTSVTAKIGMVMAMMSITSTAITAVACWRLSTLSGDYSELSAKEYPAVVQMGVANRAAVEMTYAAYRAMAYPANDTQAKIARSMSRFGYGDAVEALDKASSSILRSRATSRRSASSSMRSTRSIRQLSPTARPTMTMPPAASWRRSISSLPICPIRSPL